jgi:hypothetical protein
VGRALSDSCIRTGLMLSVFEFLRSSSMLKKVLIITAMALQCKTSCFAQATAPAAPADPHRAYDQKVRECKKMATDQHLTGEGGRAFIAQCVKSAL